MADVAESSSQALEKYLAAQLVDLKLDVPSDDVEYMARLVEEDGLEVDEKVEGVKGMLEGVVEGGLDPEHDAEIDTALRKVVAEWDRLLELEAARLAEADNSAPSTSLPPEDSTPKLSEKEIARQFAMRYAYVEGDLAELYIEDGSARPQGAPPKGVGLTEAESKRLAEEKRIQVLEALKMDGKKKKHKKQQEVDLLAPNLNRDKVNMRVQLEKEAQRKASQTVRDRDKAALEKQKADIAKAKADKQKKAAKQERRG